MSPPTADGGSIAAHFTLHAYTSVPKESHATGRILFTHFEVLTPSDLGMSEKEAATFAKYIAKQPHRQSVTDPSATQESVQAKAAGSPARHTALEKEPAQRLPYPLVVGGVKSLPMPSPSAHLRGASTARLGPPRQYDTRPPNFSRPLAKDLTPVQMPNCPPSPQTPHQASALIRRASPVSPECPSSLDEALPFVAPVLRGPSNNGSKKRERTLEPFADPQKHEHMSPESLHITCSASDASKIPKRSKVKAVTSHRAGPTDLPAVAPVARKSSEPKYLALLDPVPNAKTMLDSGLQLSGTLFPSGTFQAHGPIEIDYLALNGLRQHPQGWHYEADDLLERPDTDPLCGLIYNPKLEFVEVAPGIAEDVRRQALREQGWSEEVEWLGGYEPRDMKWWDPLFRR